MKTGNSTDNRNASYEQFFKLWTTQTILSAGDNQTVESSKGFCLKQDTRAVTVLSKATVQQNESTYSLPGPVAKRLIFKSAYTFTFQIQNSKTTTIILYMSATSVRLLACSKSRGFQPHFNEFIIWNSTEIWRRNFYWHLVSGDATDIWYRRSYCHLVPGDSTDILYRIFYWHLVPEDPTDIWCRISYWHLIQEILLTFGTRRFYWQVVQVILLTFGTRRFYRHLVQEFLMAFGTRDSTDIWYQEILLTFWYQEILLGFGTGDSTDIYYQEIILTFGTGDSTGIWYQEILLTLGTRRFYWRLVQEIALKFGTGNSTEIWRHILVLVKIGQHWRTLDNETDLHVCLHLLCDSLSAPWNTKMSGTEVVRTTKAHILCSLYFSCRW